jgi:glycosyltransferase involved in cell wall biosynthesis
MRLSVIIATRNRSRGIAPCLNSIAVAFARAGPLDAEIVIGDNGSTDDTGQIIAGWAGASSVSVKLVTEPRPGKGRALNRALRAAEGELLALLDDDCRLHPDHINDLLRHDAADTGLVLRGGRVELGDPTDLPFTINTSRKRRQWSLSDNSLRREGIAGIINGCNMAMRRALWNRLGPYDESFGPGSVVGSGDDTDYIFRAYLAGATIEYVPDMAVLHHHGRKTVAAGYALWRKYGIGSGGLYAKYLFRHPNLCRQFYWDLRDAAKEVITGSNTFLPEIGFSYKDKVTYAVRGAFRYWVKRRIYRTGKVLRGLHGYDRGDHSVLPEKRWNFAPGAGVAASTEAAGERRAG